MSESQNVLSELGNDVAEDISSMSGYMCPEEDSLK